MRFSKFEDNFHISYMRCGAESYSFDSCLVQSDNYMVLAK
jgi:hypothetical protein